MNKLKDIFYDKNDMLVALVILALAAALIFWRVDVIMSYPETLIANATGGTGQNGNGGHNSGTITAGGIYGPDEGTTTVGGVDGPDGVTTTGGGIDDPDTPDGGHGGSQVEICAIYISYGETTETIAQYCVAAGFFESSDQFIALVNERGVGSMLQSGQHYIPSNATPDEVIDYLLKPGL